MNAERFKKLIEVVEQVPEERFKMKDWVTQDECGTVGCACGWYAISQPERFVIYPKSRSVHRRDEVGAIGFSDWASEFEIEDEDARRLFDPDEYDSHSKRDVLVRLREFYTENAFA